MKAKSKVIFEDSEVIALNKLPGILSIPDRYQPDLFNLYNYLHSSNSQIRIVHRLDKDTSGVILFAKNEVSHKILNDQFQDHSISKVYHALIQGTISPESGQIEAPIAIKSPGRYMVSTKGKPAITQYKVLQEFGTLSLVELSPLTGRTHQIRVHLQYLGHPIIADKTYGSGIPFMLSDFKKRFNLKKNSNEKPLLDRTALHAISIEFIHHLLDRKMKIEAPYPKDIRATLNQLIKINT